MNLQFLWFNGLFSHNTSKSLTLVPSLDYDKMVLCLANIHWNRHARCVLFALKVLMQAFFFTIKCPYARKFWSPTKLVKHLVDVDVHGLYQLLHWQVYRNGLKLWVSNIKIGKWRIIKQKVANNVFWQKLTNDIK